MWGRSVTWRTPETKEKTLFLKSVALAVQQQKSSAHGKKKVMVKNLAKSNNKDQW